MAEHLWSVLCQQMTANPLTNNVSLQEIIEDVQLAVVAPDPTKRLAFIANWSLVTTWLRTDPNTPENIEERVEFIAPDGTVIIGPLDNVWSLQEQSRTRSAAKVEVLALKGSGTYLFRISHKKSGAWVHDVDVPVTIAITEQPTAR